MYMAFITRASQGDTDNSGIIEEIRQLRYFDTYSHAHQASLPLHPFTFYADRVGIKMKIRFTSQKY